MFYDIYLYTLCYYICCLLGACMRCTRLCPLKPGVTSPETNLGQQTQSRLAGVQPRTSSAFSTRPRVSRAMLQKVPTLPTNPTRRIDRSTLPTNSARRTNRPTLRGRPADQLPGDQLIVEQSSESARQGERLSPHRADPQGRNPDRRRRPTTAVTRHNDNKTRPGRTYQY
jgi:hypothetical protein